VGRFTMSSGRKGRARYRRGVRPELERCEDRRLLSTIGVPRPVEPSPFDGPPPIHLRVNRGLQPMRFDGVVDQGPDQGLELRGALTLRPAGSGGLSRGRLAEDDGPVVPVTGRVVGGRIVLRFDLGGGRTVRASGTFRPSSVVGGGFVLGGDGDLSGPAAGAGAKAAGAGRVSAAAVDNGGSWAVGPGARVSIALNYTYDTNNFFNTQARRDLLQLAADVLASRLDDTLTAIQPSGTNTWSAQFSNPATGATQAVSNLNVPSNTITVFAGGRDLPTGQLGIGGPGGFSAGGTQAWLNTVRGRGQAGALLAPQTDVGPWGGSITFDTVGTNWNFGRGAVGITSTQADFFSVALHELGHVLGINSGTAFTRYVTATNLFTGPNAVARNRGVGVPVAPDRAHWANGTRYGAGEVSLDPALLLGTRKLTTELDFAGLKDVGWQVTPPSAAAFDWDRDAVADLAVVQRSGTTSGQTEVNILSGASSFQTSLVRAITARAATDSRSEFLFTDWNRDGVPDLAIVQRSGTASGRTELSILSGFGGFQQSLLASATALGATDASYEFQWTDWDNDGIQDLAVVRRSGTASGRTELTILSGASNFQKTSLQVATARAATDAQSEFLLTDWDQDGIPDLAIVQRSGTTSGRTEVQILSGASNFQQGLLQVATARAATDLLTDFALTDWNRDRIPDLAIVQRSGTASGRTEVQILSGAGNFQTSLAQVATAQGPTDARFEFAI
jgi:hypothetical protein